MAYKKDWSEFYDITKSKPPRPLLVEALKYVSRTNKVIDIGAGALRDTKYLLEKGFEVTVIDSSPLMIDHANDLKNDKLHAFVTKFEDFDFPKNEYNLASAMYSLPFCSPKSFNQVFEKIKNSLKVGGIFCGQLFGNRDEWSNNKNMTFHTLEQARQLLSGLDIISLEEEEKDDKTGSGDMKHWHVFHFIARK